MTPALFTRDQLGSVRIFMTAALNGCMDELLREFRLLRKLRATSLKNASELPADHERLRQKYRMFPLFISTLVEKCVCADIASAPTSLYDGLLITDWVGTRKMETSELTTADKLFDTVYDCIKPVVSRNRLLFLYGNTDLLLNRYDDPSAPSQLYEVKRLGALSRQPYTIQRLSDTNETYSLPMDDDDTNIVCQRIAEAAGFMTPIWMQHRLETGHVYMTLQRTTRKSNGCGMDEILNGRSIYPVSDGYSHEYISNRMHVSTLILDCDLYSDRDKRIDEHQLYVDMVSLVNSVMKRCEGIGGQLVHYLFRSSNVRSGARGGAVRVDDNLQHRKYGIHHHVGLPTPYVMTNGACGQIVKILNTVRYKFPGTIGVECYGDNFESNNSNVYYPMIYVDDNVRRASVGRGHALRGVDQHKEDGTQRLVCVYRTDELPVDAPIPTHRKYAHAGLVSKELVGNVIDRFVDIRSITDEEYLRDSETTTVDSYARQRCTDTIPGIAAEINKRCVLFVPGSYGAKETVVCLLVLLNSLWDEYNGRVSMMAHMTAARGNGGIVYSKRDKKSMQNLARFVSSESGKKACLALVPEMGRTTTTIAGVAYLPFCPNRPHHTRNNAGGDRGGGGSSGGVRVNVFYRSGMVSFGLTTQCFKTSCQRLGMTSRLHTDTVLEMLPIFIGPCYKRFFTDMIEDFSCREVNYITIIEPRAVRGGNDGGWEESWSEQGCGDGRAGNWFYDDDDNDDNNVCDMEDDIVFCVDSNEQDVVDKQMEHTEEASCSHVEEECSWHISYKNISCGLQSGTTTSVSCYIGGGVIDKLNLPSMLDNILYMYACIQSLRTIIFRTKLNFYVCIHSNNFSGDRVIVACDNPATLIACLRCKCRITDRLFSEQDCVRWLAILDAVVCVMRTADGQTLDEGILSIDTRK